MKLFWMTLGLVPVLVLGACGSDPEPTAPSTAPSVSVSAEAEGYVDQVVDLCRDLLAEVLTFDIGNAVTIEQFLGKHEPLVAAIRAFDAQVDAIPVTEGDRPAADAFDAYRRLPALLRRRGRRGRGSGGDR